MTFTLTFDLRPMNRSILFSGKHVPGKKLGDRPIQPGDLVTLHKGEVQVLVDVTEAASQQSIAGTVRGFENFEGESLEGLTFGNVVTFAKDHVFTCTPL